MDEGSAEPKPLVNDKAKPAKDDADRIRKSAKKEHYCKLVIVGDGACGKVRL